MGRRAVASALFGWIFTISVAAVPVDLRVAPFVTVDELFWHIAGSGGDPNILSELTWSALWITGLEAQATVVLSGPFELRGRARAGWIVSGDNQDSDYNLDDREDEYSRSNNSGAGGLAWDLSGAVGYRLGRAGRFSVLPLLGLEVAQQRLRMSDGFQTIPASGPIEGLESRYVATWWGPWVGAGALLATGDRSALRVEASYHLLGYYAWADWNLRTDFQHPKSYEHVSWGQALRASAGFEIAVSPSAMLSLQAEMALAAAAPGTDRTFFINGSVGETRLNGVWWHSYGGSAGVRFRL